MSRAFSSIADAADVARTTSRRGLLLEKKANSSIKQLVTQNQIIG
jgi:hypothetical protein